MSEQDQSHCRFGMATFNLAPSGFEVSGGTELVLSGEGNYDPIPLSDLTTADLKWLVGEDMADVDDLVEALASSLLAVMLEMLDGARPNDTTRYLLDVAHLFSTNAREGLL